MIKQTEHNTYKIMWGEYGISFAAVYIYVRVPFLFFFKRWKLVYEGFDNMTSSTTLYSHAKFAKPEWIYKWFDYALNKYEENERAWGRL